MRRGMGQVVRLGALGLALAVLAAGCGEGHEEGEEKAERHENAEGELSAFELENGIGPVKEAVTLSAIDLGLAATGITTSSRLSKASAPTPASARLSRSSCSLAAADMRGPP